MNKNRHLNLDARLEIQHGLSEGLSFKAIASSLGKDCTTISKEIRGHVVFQKKGAPYRPFNDCANRRSCTLDGGLCPDCGRHRRCSCCGSCTSVCPEYVKEECPLLLKPPYVCNGCSSLSKCTLEKHMYDAVLAQKEYSDVKSESRSGFSLTKAETMELDAFISPLLKAGQSLHHIMVNNPDRINCCEKTAYAYMDGGIFTARNLDMPRKVRFRPRKRKSVPVKVDKACRKGRVYSDFKAYMEEHPGSNLVEIDSVEGVKGGAVLLTIHFVRQEFQLAFRRDHNDSASVTEAFNSLYELLGRDKYCEMFQVVLADNGTEFSDPAAIETAPDGTERSRVFYCDPSAPNQKGSCEVNHEFIRRVIPKKTDITPYTQEQVSLMMSHINSYSRPELGNRTPFDMLSFYFGSDIPALLGISRIEPNSVILRPSLLE